MSSDGRTAGRYSEVEDKISWLISNAASSTSSISYLVSFRPLKFNGFCRFVSSHFSGFMGSRCLHTSSLTP